jgi:hypothetical protein
MKWLVFSASLPSKSASAPRVALWRRLQRLGAVAPLNGLHLLPEREACLEDFQWLAQEVRQSGGNAVILWVEQIEGFTDGQLVTLFHEQIESEYRAIESTIRTWEQESATITKEALAKVRRHLAEIQGRDYFQSRFGSQLVRRLETVDTTSGGITMPDIPTCNKEDYQQRQWITRPRPHVDRLASVWFIRRFIDPHASIRYGLDPRESEVSFDMTNGTFSHIGSLCTFEVMIRAFGCTTPPLLALAEIVHEADLRDGRYAPPELAGVLAILQGWRQLPLEDIEREQQGMALFEGLYIQLQAHEGAPL